MSDEPVTRLPFSQLKAFIETLGVKPEDVMKVEITPSIILVTEYLKVDGKPFVVGSKYDPQVQAGGYELQPETEQKVGDVATKQTRVFVHYSEEDYAS